METIRTILYADGTAVELQTPGLPLEETPVCCGCREPCRIVLEGEEMKPTEEGMYCQTCVRRLWRSKRIPTGLVVKYPTLHETPGRETTCWGCGKTIKLQEASELVKKE